MRADLSTEPFEPQDFGVDSLVDNADLVERRRALILDEATRLFGQKGYHETTIRDIAKVAGISTGLVYSYVKNKEDVLFLIVARVLDYYEREMTAALKGVKHPVIRFKIAFRTYCNGVINHKYPTLLAFRNVVSLPKERRDMIKQLNARANLVLAREIDACIEAGYFRQVEPKVAAEIATHLAQAWSLKMWHFEQYSTPAEFVETALEIILNGLSGAEPGRSRRVDPDV